MVIGVSFDPAYERSPAPPAFGLYLDERWSPPWPHEHVDWPDFGLPVDAEAMRASLQALLARARSGEEVEVGCLGGHGRTGTALACLAVLTGCAPADSVSWVRSSFCDDARALDEAVRADPLSAYGPGGISLSSVTSTLQQR